MSESKIDALVQAKRALSVLNQRGLSPEAYHAEWERLEAEKTEAARGLTQEQLQIAHERAQFAC